MELKEAIKILKDDNEIYKLNKLLNDTLNIECPKYYEAIETVLQALENTQKNYEIAIKQNITYKQNIHDLKENSYLKRK